MTAEENLFSDSVNALKLWKQLIDTNLEGKDKSAETSDLQEVVKDFCLIEFNSNKAAQAYEEVVDYFNNETNDHGVDVEELYKEKLTNNQNIFNSNYQQQKLWKEIFMGVTDHDVEEVEQSTSQNEEETEYEEMHDSIYYSNVFTPPVDPISKMVIQNPYKNKTCGHIYEYKFILQYIKSMKNKARCPYIGCGSRNITVAQLVQDNDTKIKIENYVKRESQSNGNESDED